MNDMSAITGVPGRIDQLAGVPRKPVLIIVHQENSNPARVGHWFRDRGFPLDIRRPRYGDPLPETMDAHCAAVVFGGPMSANDPDDYMKRETDWLAVPLAEQAPLLGICLGGQMLARHLGGTVSRHPRDVVEIGYHPIALTEAGAALGDWPEIVYQWHNEGFTLPSGALRLATGDVFENQAFSFGDRALGLQFHPEMSFSLVNRWSGRNPDRLKLDGARPRPEHLQGHLMYAPIVQDWLDRMLTRLLTSDLAEIAPGAAETSLSPAG